jgi:hypothetical protein
MNQDSHNFGVPRLGVPPNVFSEALHGMVSGCGHRVKFDAYTSTGCPTSFPQVKSDINGCVPAILHSHCTHTYTVSPSR